MMSQESVMSCSINRHLTQGHDNWTTPSYCACYVHFSHTSPFVNVSAEPDMCTPHLIQIGFKWNERNATWRLGSFKKHFFHQMNYQWISPRYYVIRLSKSWFCAYMLFSYFSEIKGCGIIKQNLKDYKLCKFLFMLCSKS